MKKLTCFCIAFFLLLAAAGCQGDRDASSSRGSVSSAAASSRPAVSSNPVSSVPPVLSEPLGALNLAFEQRVYVDTFFEDGYFNQNGEWVYWVKPDAAVPDKDRYHVFHGSYLDLYYFPRQGDGYLQLLRANLADAVQVSGSPHDTGDETAFRLSGLRRDGSVVHWSSGNADSQLAQFCKDLLAWRDVVCFVDYTDVIGLKDDGTLLYEQYPKEVNVFQQQFRDSFDPSVFHDIVAIAPDWWDNFTGQAQHYLYLLRKDGVLLNARNQELYHGVARLFPSGRETMQSYILLETGELISLETNPCTFGFPENPEQIVTIKEIGPTVYGNIPNAIYALMEDGSLQMISDDAQTDRELARQEAISQVTDCKTS